MEYVIRILTFALIPIIVGGVLAFLRRPKKTEKGKVCLPIALAIVGVICSAAFLIPTFIYAFSDESIWTTIIFLLFSMFSASLIVAYINCRISYDEDGFTAKSFFGIKRWFTYDQITGIRHDMPWETFLYMGKHRIMIDEFGVGGKDFLCFVNQKYRKLYKEPIPDKKPIPKKITKDNLNGSLESNSRFWVAWIAIGILGMGLLILIVCLIVFSQPYTPSNTVQRQVIFQSCHKKGADWILTAADGQIYKIEDAYRSLDAERIASLCDGKTALTAYSEGVSPSRHNRQFYYSIKALVRGEEYVLTFDETNRFYKQGGIPLIIFLITLNLVDGALFAGAVIVGRNPSKYSKKVVRFFFRPGYLKSERTHIVQRHRKKR